MMASLQPPGMARAVIAFTNTDITESISFLFSETRQNQAQPEHRAPPRSE